MDSVNLRGGLHAPAREHLVGVMMMVMLMVMVMLVIMATAGAVLVMLMLFVVMVMMMFMLVIVVIMIVAATGAVLIVFIMVMMMVLMVMLMLVVVLMLHVLQLFVQSVVLHRLDYLLAAELVPRRADESGLGIEPLEKLGRGKDLFRARSVGAAHDDEVGVLYLIVEELAEVAHVHAALARIDDSDLCADVHPRPAPRHAPRR